MQRVRSSFLIASADSDVAARLLGISRRSLYYELEEHGLLAPEPGA